MFQIIFWLIKSALPILNGVAIVLHIKTLKENLIKIMRPYFINYPQILIKGLWINGILNAPSNKAKTLRDYWGVREIFIVIMLSLLKRFYDSSAIYLWKEVNIIFTLF